MAPASRQPAAESTDSATYRRGVDLPLSLLLQQQHALPPNSAHRVHPLSQLPGLRPAPLRGHGLEFEDLREYSVGDDIRFIDWNVTARTRRFHTRLYREERERTVTLALDLRPAMFTGTDSLRAESAARLGVAMLWQAMQGGDRVACMLLDIDGIHTTRPQHGPAGALAACNLIAERYEHALARPDAADPGLDELLVRISQANRQQGLVLLLSGLDGVIGGSARSQAKGAAAALAGNSSGAQSGNSEAVPLTLSEAVTNALAVIGHRRHCTIIWTLDPLEHAAAENVAKHALLPNGFYRIQTDAIDTATPLSANAGSTPSTRATRDRAISVTTEAAERMRERLHSQLQPVRELLERTACHHLVLPTDTDAATLHGMLRHAGLL